MKAIRIIKTPESRNHPTIAPQWVGVVIPLPTEESLRHRGPETNTPPDGSHLVYVADALQSLREQGRLDAFRYWNSLELRSFLRFPADACEVIEVSSEIEVNA